MSIGPEIWVLIINLRLATHRDYYILRIPYSMYTVHLTLAISNLCEIISFYIYAESWCAEAVTLVGGPI